jgi:endonuclease-3
MKTLNKKDYSYIFSYLEELFPNADTELHYETPFQLLTAVILSAQTTDKQVNKVTDTLFEKIKQPEDVIKMGHKKFDNAIKSI